MSLSDLFAVNDALLRNTSRYGEAVTMYDTSAGSDAGTPFDGVFEVLGSDQYLRTPEQETQLEQATVEVPMSITVTPSCWFLARGQRWNYLGLGGRDANLQTIQVQAAAPVAKKTANRR